MLVWPHLLWLQRLLWHEHGVLLLLGPVHQLAHYVNRNGKYNSAVVLSRYAIQGLKIP